MAILISNGWVQCKGKNLFISFSDKEYSNLPVLSATQDKGMILRDESNINFSYNKTNKLGYKRVLPGQFVIHLRSFQGGFAYSRLEGITSPAYTVFGFKTSYNHNPEYWEQVFKSEKFIRTLEKITYGIRDGRSISYNDFLSLKLNYPIIEEQEKISQLLYKLDKVITLEQEKLEHLTDIYNYLSSKLFPKKSMVSPVLRKIQKSEDWKKYQLGEYGESFGGLTGKTKNDFGHGEAKYITYKNIFDNIFVDSNQLDATPIDHKQNKVLFGDALFTLSSEIPEEVGMSSVCLLEIEELYVNSFSFGYRLNPDKEVNYLYLAYYFRSVEFRNKMRILAQGISRYNISQQQVMDQYILLPDIEEQKFVGEVLNTNNQYIKLQNKKIKKLKTLRQFLLQNLFI